MGSTKNEQNNGGVWINAKQCLYEEVIVPMVEAWGMRSVERRKVNVIEIKCLRSLVGVSQTDS